MGESLVTRLDERDSLIRGIRANASRHSIFTPLRGGVRGAAARRPAGTDVEATVAIYEYRCDRHDVFEITRALGTAPPSAECPECGAMAGRIISLPSVRCGARTGVLAAIDRADKSRFEPEVVSAPPRKRRSNVIPLTPQLARLPRP